MEAAVTARTLGETMTVSTTAPTTGSWNAVEVIPAAGTPAVDAASETTRYTAGAVLNENGAVIQRTISLPGGASLTMTPPAASEDPWVEAWFYPNLHGDVILQADTAGARVGVRAVFDPFGQPIDPVTGDIGTAAADDAVLDTTPGDADLAFVGGHGKLYEHGGTIATIEMGARQYVAALGRFLEVDPIEGGVSNSYDYPSDPINKLDLSGKCMGSIYVPEKYCDNSRGGTKSVVRAPQVPPSTTNSSGPINPAPTDCSRKTCHKGDFSLELCVMFCVSPGVSIREDGAVYGTFGVGLGVKEAIAFKAGGSTVKGNGSSVTIDGSCSAAAGLGYYAGGSLALADQWANVWASELVTFQPSSGVVIGEGIGCSGGFNASVPLWGE